MSTDKRLTVDEALAELDRQPAHILAIEAAHGFVFGDTGDRGTAQPVAAVACTTPGCDRQGRLLHVRADTVQPVHCGGCSTVLHCDHQPEVTRFRGGNLANPVEHTVATCSRCGTETGRTTVDLDPAAVLRSIPLTALDQLLAGG